MIGRRCGQAIVDPEPALLWSVESRRSVVVTNQGQVDEAVSVWVGQGLFSWPRPSEERVVAEFGSDLAVDLVPAVHALWRDYESSDARWKEPDYNTMCDMTKADFQRLHPEVGQRAVDALDWLFSYTNR